MPRIAGGFRGILSAIAHEILDPEDADYAPDDGRFVHLTGSDRRAADKRGKRRAKARNRSPF